LSIRENSQKILRIFSERADFFDPQARHEDAERYRNGTLDSFTMGKKLIGQHPI